jgi:hypothetical protein
MGNKLKVVLIAVVVVVILSALIFLMLKKYEIPEKNRYTIELYACSPIYTANDQAFIVELENLSKQSSQGINSFSPIIELHELVNGGNVFKAYIPMGGLNGIWNFLTGEYNTTMRAQDEIEYRDDLFLDANFLNCASRISDPNVPNVKLDYSNVTTEFVISSNIVIPKKYHLNLTDLHSYLNGLFTDGKLNKSSKIKVYYTCGSAPQPTDADGDGYEASKDCNDNDAQINEAVKEVCGDSKDNNCDGNIDEGCDGIEPLKPPTSEESGSNSNSPINFNIIDSRVNWDNGPDELELKFEVYKANGTNPSVKLKIKRGGECIISKDEHDELSGSLKSVNGKLSGSVFYRSGSRWVFTNLVVDCTKLQYN